jgi:hypothetical protein
MNPNDPGELALHNAASGIPYERRYETSAYFNNDAEPTLVMKERVARALRAMGKEPRALLFIDGNTEWTWDSADICGVPVLHGIELRCFHADRSSDECPFIPLGATETEINFLDRKRFSEAWSS